VTVKQITSHFILQWLLIINDSIIIILQRSWMLHLLEELPGRYL